MGANNQTQFLAKTKLLTGSGSINLLKDEINPDTHSPLLVVTDKGIKDSPIYDQVVEAISELDLDLKLFDDVKLTQQLVLLKKFSTNLKMKTSMPF